ncbi:MAG: PDZ domain-containing protein [Moraxellaceae bacterium]|nr:PDZ domain-containing protein [Moraxellaceae bacterium]
MLANIHYLVTSNHPAAHRFQVQLDIESPDSKGQVLWLPDWIPGSYMIRDFARNLSGLQAVNAQGQVLSIQAINKSTWRIEPCQGRLSIRYEVYAWDMSVRSAYLDQYRGYFNGTSLFLAVAGQEDQLHSVELVAPEGCSQWRVATTLSTRDTALGQFGLYEAANYEELIDHPVEMGEFAYHEFTVCGVPHALAVSGMQQGDLARLCADLSRICEAQIQFFGQPAPFARYLFQLNVVGQGYGGLEHRSSTSLIASRDSLPSRQEPEAPSAGYLELLGLCSHEYFHSWNVKRLKPAEMLAPDLQREVHSELLWFFEGVTSYYDDLFLLRTGIISTPQWLTLLAKTITRHVRTPGRLQQTLAASSFDAWTRFYKQDENTPNAVVSYYVKGALVALCIDLTLRKLSDHEASLDVLMQQLWQRYLSGQAGVTEQVIRDMLVEMVGPAIQEPLTRWLHSTDELPFAALLAEFGVKVSMTADAGKANCGLGVSIKPCAEGGVTLSVVTRGSAAEQAGLSAGDTVVAINGLRISAQNWEKQLAQYRPGETVSVYAFRRDEWLSASCILRPAIIDLCTLTADDSERGQQALAKWLDGNP